jgi:hypothetical protein
MSVLGLNRGGGVPAIRLTVPREASDLVAALRLAICEDCTGGKKCPLGGCCEKPISEKVTWAFERCPKGNWPMNLII